MRDGGPARAARPDWQRLPAGDRSTTSSSRPWRTCRPTGPRSPRGLAAWPLGDRVTAHSLDFTAVWRGGGPGWPTSAPATPPDHHHPVRRQQQRREPGRLGLLRQGNCLLSPFWTSASTRRCGRVPSRWWSGATATGTSRPLDEEYLDLTDATDYNCVLTPLQEQGFELLNHDRALYQQWIAATNNTDVSPTQLRAWPC